MLHGARSRARSPRIADEVAALAIRQHRGVASMRQLLVSPGEDRHRDAGSELCAARPKRLDRSGQMWTRSGKKTVRSGGGERNTCGGRGVAPPGGPGRARRPSEEYFSMKNIGESRQAR